MGECSFPPVREQWSDFLSPGCKLRPPGSCGSPKDGRVQNVVVQRRSLTEQLPLLRGMAFPTAPAPFVLARGPCVSTGKIQVPGGQGNKVRCRASHLPRCFPVW